MAKEGVTAWGKALDKLMSYTTKWVDELQRTTVADEAHRQFGWVDDDMDAFVLGDKLVDGGVGLRTTPVFARPQGLWTRSNRKVPENVT